MWDPPGSGVEPRSPALAGRFFTTGLLTFVGSLVKLEILAFLGTAED